MNTIDLDELQSQFSHLLLPPTNPAQKSEDTYVWGKKNAIHESALKTVSIMAAQHGNEVVGVHVLNALLPHIPKIKGGVLGMIGNVEAYKKGTRYDEEDMNRVWEKVMHAIKTGDMSVLKSYEALRAYDHLAPHLLHTDYFYDIHATINESAPMLLTPTDAIDGANLDLLAEFGIHNLIYGKKLLAKDNKPVYADSFVNQYGRGFGVTVEAGWLGDTKLAPKIVAAICSILKKLNKLNEADVPITMKDVRTWYFDAYKAHTNVPYTPGLTFDRVFENGEEISAGTVLAYTNSGPITAQTDSHIFFQKSQKSLDAGKVAVGDEVCILTAPPQSIYKDAFEKGLNGKND